MVSETALQALVPGDGNLTDQALELVSLKTSSTYWDLGFVHVKALAFDGTCAIDSPGPDCRRSGVVTIQIYEGLEVLDRNS